MKFFSIIYNNVDLQYTRINKKEAGYNYWLFHQKIIKKKKKHFTLKNIEFPTFVNNLDKAIKFEITNSQNLVQIDELYCIFKLEA